MTERLCIVVPVNVWTPGLHEFRSDFLDESMLRIPPHVSICEVQLQGRGMEPSWASRIDELNNIGREVPAFSYGLSELFWDESCARVPRMMAIDSIGSSGPLKAFWASSAICGIRVLLD